MEICHVLSIVFCSLTALLLGMWVVTYDECCELHRVNAHLRREIRAWRRKTRDEQENPSMGVVIE